MKGMGRCPRPFFNLRVFLKEKGRGSGVVSQYQNNTLDVGLFSLMLQSTNMYIGGAFRKNRLTRATFKP